MHLLHAAECAKLLLEHGADPNSADPNGKTALTTAAFEGDLELVETLLSAGADPNARDGDGLTPVMGAAKAGHPGAIRRLVSNRADPSAVDLRGRTALHWSLTQEDHPEAVALLLELGVDPMVRTTDGLRALDYAERLGRHRSKAVLLGHPH